MRQRDVATATALAGAAPTRRPRPLRRYLLGCAVIVACTTATISVAAIGVVTTIAADFALGGKPLDSSYLTPAKAGAAQTILVIGDDHIGPTTTYSTGAEQTVNGYHYLHADTFMLVRMDPSQDQTSILSIPRDMLVSFSYHGRHYTDKFNATYSVGGPDLVKKVALAMLPGIAINHVIDFNFASFLGLVDAIGCVYVDVDQRYLNDSDPSYQFINIQPGYQRLCGNKALSYVRYRHTDSDFVRVARQQDFIRQAKEQLGVWGFVSKYDQLAKAFGKAVWTDIRGTTAITQLLELAFFSLSKPVRQVPFQVENTAFPISTSIGTELTVTSTPAKIRASIDDFLYLHPTVATVATTTTTSTAKHHRHHHHVTTTKVGAHDLYPLSAGVTTQAVAVGVNVPFPVYLPSLQTGPAVPADFHAYTIGDEQHHRHYGYRIDWQVNGVGGYYGIEGMNWTNPPLFANPTATEVIGGRTYLLVDDGSHIHDIGWRQGNVLYWVSNTLQEDLTNTQMIDIANSAQPLH
jgi:polyisoprenyl-teichoic acid--peptidoglycan teichoic acid transferase